MIRLNQQQMLKTPIQNASVFLLLILLLFGSTIGFAQQKLPTIQAICKVEMISGESVIGVISLGYSYDNIYYHPNAFYYETVSEKFVQHISLSFNGFYIDNLDALGASRIYFAESRSNKPQFLYKINEDNGQNVLNRKSLREEEYILKTTFGIYKELPLAINIRAKNLPEENVIQLNINNIKTFELLQAPGSEWLEKIQKAKQRLKQKKTQDKANDNLWIGFLEPIWYHDIIKDKVEFSKWNQYFE